MYKAVVTSFAILVLSALACGGTSSVPSSPIVSHYAANSRLLRAIDTNDMAALRLAIRDGASPDTITEFGEPAVAFAAEHGRLTICQALINDGANIDAGDSQRRTALMAAGESGDPDMISMLLLHKAKPNLESDTHQTALILAARAGCLGGVRSLVYAGADLNGEDDNGNTALIYAAQSLAWQTSLANFAFLVDHASTNHENAKGQTALMFAAASGSPDGVKLLLERAAKPSTRDKLGRTALYYGAQATESSIADTAPLGSARAATSNFEKREYELNSVLAALATKTTDGVVALLLAAAAGNVGAVNGLITEGLPVNEGATPALLRTIDHPMMPPSALGSEWPDGMTPLMVAAATGHVDVMRALFAARANAAARDAKGRTAIMYAARYGRAAAVQALVQHGVDVDAADNDGRRALMHVASLGWAGMAYRGWVHSENGNTPSPDVAVIAFLLKAGADPPAKDLAGKTALDLAKDSQNTMAVMALKLGGVNR